MKHEACRFPGRYFEVVISEYVTEVLTLNRDVHCEMEPEVDLRKGFRPSFTCRTVTISV